MGEPCISGLLQLTECAWGFAALLAQFPLPGHQEALATLPTSILSPQQRAAGPGVRCPAEREGDTAPHCDRPRLAVESEPICKVTPGLPGRPESPQFPPKLPGKVRTRLLLRLSWFQDLCRLEASTLGRNPHTPSPRKTARVTARLWGFSTEFCRK